MAGNKNKVPVKSVSKVPPPPPPPAPAAKMVNAPPKTAEMESSTALAKPIQANELTTGAPAWLQAKMNAAGGAPRGLDKMDSADLILPRLVLAQSLSPEVARPDEFGLEGDRLIRVGDIFENLSKEVICRAGDELEIIPIVLAKTRMHLQPFADGGGILCRSDDALKARPGGDGVNAGNEPTQDCLACVRKEWDDEKGKPECSLFYNIIVLVPSRGYAPFVWSCKHTNVKVVKRFLSTAKQLGADFFARKYAIAAVTEQSANFTYKNFIFRSVDWVNEAEYARADSFFKSLEGKTWTPNTEDIATEVEAESASTEAPSEAASESTVEATASSSSDDDVAF